MVFVYGYTIPIAASSATPSPLDAITPSQRDPIEPARKSNRAMTYPLLKTPIRTDLFPSFSIPGLIIILTFPYSQPVKTLCSQPGK